MRSPRGLPSEGQTLIEKLEKYAAGDIEFAVVLATPDDEAFARGKQDEKRFRARQNVVLELGLLLAVLGRSRVAILLKNQDEMERPSDIQGLIYLPFRDDVAETKVLLAKEMGKQGIRIEVSKLYTGQFLHLRTFHSSSCAIRAVASNILGSCSQLIEKRTFTQPPNPTPQKVGFLLSGRGLGNHRLHTTRIEGTGWKIG